MNWKFFTGVFILASILSIACKTYAWPNQTPIAVINDCPKYADVNETVQFDGNDSYDQDEGGCCITDYLWTFPPEAIDISGQGTAYASCVFDSMGIYTVKLKVKDDEGTWSTDTSCTVYIGDPNRVHNITQDKWYSHIQPAIDDANDGDEIAANQSTYYEIIDFSGTNITLRSTDPNDWEVVEATIIDADDTGSVVTFSGSEDPNCVLSGFTIVDGYTSGRGGGVSGNDTLAGISKCTIRNNSAGYGGGLADCDGTISNCLIYGNSADYGGGMNNCDGDIINCTIVYNTATIEGGGLRRCDGTITNCIVWSNDPNQLYDSVDPNYSCIEDWTGGGTGNITDNPVFVDPNNDDYHIAYNSPCINAGDPNGNYTGQTDIDGQPRVMQGTVDMGADEVPPQIWNVNKNLGYDTIQAAINAASDGDTIMVAKGTYYENINFSGKAITLSSWNPDEPDTVDSTIIDGNSVSHVVTFNTSEDANSVLTGFTITKGDDNGIYCYQASPTISKCVVTGNVLRGMYLDHYSSPTISNCTVSNNANRGVGVNYYSSPTITDCIISNHGDYGIYCYYYSSATITNCTIKENTNYGLRCGLSSSPMVSGCVISQNSQYGMYSDSSPMVKNCTISNNNGYGIYGTCGYIKNCILWDNIDDLFGCSATYSCTQGWYSGLGNISVDPMFVDASNGDYHLKINSLCINAGDPNSDYEKEPSPNGGRINLGAYGNTSEATTGVDEDGDGISDVWELYYWPNDNPNQHDPNDDPDGDGLENMSEYHIDWDPKTENSNSIPGYVKNNTTDFKYPSISWAISFANPVVVLIVDPNTFYETINFYGKPVHVRSADPNDPNVVTSTIIDVNDPNTNVVTFDWGEDANSILEGITITGGQNGIYCTDNSAPKITKCIIKDNSLRGIYCDSASPVVTNCTIDSNAGRGFGMTSSCPTISNCTISNHDDYGVYCYRNSSPVISSCTISSNGDTSVEYNVICHWDSSPTIKNCIIVSSSGYGIYCVESSAPAVVNCTIANNGSYGIYYYQSLASIECTNCIFWGNNNADLKYCSATFSCIEDGDSGLDNFTPPDPMFVDADNGDYRLLAWSRCIDRGDPNSDYSKEPAPNGGRINVGAYGNTPEATTSPTDEDGDGMADEWEVYYWPGTDPNQHDPNDDPDGDNFLNRIEYLFGYDPNEYTDEPMHVLAHQWWPFQIDPTAGEILNIGYWLNKDANDVEISFVGAESEEIVREISQTGVAGINYAYQVWDGTDADDLVVEPNFFDITIVAKAQSDPNDEDTWTSPEGYITILRAIQNLVVDYEDFDPYANIPVQIDFDHTNWGRPILKICEDNTGGGTVIYTFMDADRLLSPGHHTFYWYGRDSDGNVYDDVSEVWYGIGTFVKSGAVVVYPVFKMENLRCNTYRIIPTYNEVSEIKYELNRNANVTIDITDPDGNHFRALLDGASQTAGSQEVIWDGKDDSGRYVSTEGVYSVTVTVEDSNYPDINATEIGSITAYR